MLQTSKMPKKTVILAGGFGTRLSEMTENLPKPMIEIGGKPILWHIMSLYASYGCTEFILALGYRAEIIKEYFLHFFSLNNNFTIDLANGKTTVHNPLCPNWRIHLINTGLETQTGGRMKRVLPWIGDEPFLMTYGDGVGNIDIEKLIAFHKSHGKLATITAVRPPARFGGLVLEDNKVVEFSEKSQIKEGWINGGFFVLEPQVLDLIKNDTSIWEREPLEWLAEQGELMAYYHTGFWQPMDTLRDYRLLQSLWESGKAPWTIPNEEFLHV